MRHESDDMRVIEANTYEAYITVGQVRGYHGTNISMRELEGVCAEFQREFEMKRGFCCGVRVVASEVVFQSYIEPCWDVHVINYPRFSQTRRRISEFVAKLAKRLLVDLDQERITVVGPGTTMTFERKDADESRVHNG